MNYTIQHEVPGRVRVKLVGRVPEADIDALTRALRQHPVIQKATVYPRMGSLAVAFDPAARAQALAAIAAIDRTAAVCQLQRPPQRVPHPALRQGALLPIRTPPGLAWSG